MLTLIRAVECCRGEKTTCWRRDAPLDTKSSRASPTHTSRPSWNNPMVRKLALSLFSSRGEKKWEYLNGGVFSPSLSLSLLSQFELGVLSRRRDAVRHWSPRGSVPRVWRRESVGQEIKYYPEESEKLSAKLEFSSRTIAKFWSLRPDGSARSFE